MAWARNRALGVIGAGAIVVAAIALGVAVGHHGRSHHRPFLRLAERGFFSPFGPGLRGGPFDGGPMQQRLQVTPGMPDPGIPMPAGPQLRRFGPGPAFAVAGILHGEGTVAGPNGRYQTIDIQRGNVTKLGKGSITVRSADGFTKSYAASTSLLRAVTKGDLVQLRATVSGSKATVVTLTDLTRMTRSSSGGGFSTQ